MDISDIAKGCSFKVFSGAVENGGSVRCINAKKAGLSRKEIDALGEFVKTYGAKGLEMCIRDRSRSTAMILLASWRRFPS